MTEITKREFTKTKNNEQSWLYTLKNDKIEVSVTNYGATITSILAPDKNQNMGDIVLGYDTATEYEQNGGYFGATIGRYANRIGGAKFELNGVTYRLAANDGENHLHGGKTGFDKKLWDACEKDAKLIMKTKSSDMEENYPGNLEVEVSFSLEDDALIIEYCAVSDKDTVINLTNHSYFNLSGKGNILNHELTVNADKFTRVDGNAIPTGELPEVKGTPLDFTSAHTIGERIDADDEDLKAVGGYDHNFVIRGEGMRLAAKFADKASGRAMEVYTDNVGLQIYTGNMIDPVKGKNGERYGKRSGCCFETQCFPDSPNQPSFPSCLLKAGETYATTTKFRFFAE